MAIKITEQQVHNAACDYLRSKYPGVIFTSESSGLKLPIGLAVKVKRQRSSSGLPDLFILRPSRGYCGLLLEIKATTLHLYNKNGTIKLTEHLNEQSKILSELNKLGYFARFACGIDECVEIIDWYLS